MRYILKVLKKYSLILILVICLIIIQANCDLKLPEYTANIVNVGIQQNGIESATLKYLSEEVYEKIMLVNNNENKEKIANSYKYNGNYYELKNNDEIIDKIIKESLIIVLTVKNNFFNIGFNSEIEFYELLKTNHEILNLVKEKIVIDEELKEQTIINYGKEEYKNLGISVSELQINYVLKVGLKMLFVSFMAAFVTILSSFLSSRVSAFIARDLRGILVNKVMTFAHEDFEKFSTSSLITRITNDVSQVQMLIMMSLRILCFAPIMGIGAILKVQGSSLGWIIIAAILFVLSFIISIFVFVTPKFKIVQQKIDGLNLISKEFISGIPVIRAFAKEKYQENKFNEASKGLQKISLFLNAITSILGPIMNLIMNITCILIIWYGAQKIEMGSLQIGTLIAFMTYTIHIIMSFLMISMFSIMLPRSIVSIKRISQVLNEESSIKNKEKTINLKKIEGAIEFKDVYFRYKDAEEDVLENISFCIPAGSTTAFIGSTGSGKSTLVNLIPRFLDVTAGKILVDGVDIRDLKLEKLREIIGFVPQKGILFKGNIKNNIALGVNKINLEELNFATKISCSEDFIMNFKEGYDTEISQGGTNVSGGQRQRLAIARAIAKKSKIYIFDDSFSALDYKTDSTIRKLLNKHLKNTTKLIVAQRVSTIMNADQIIVLDEGKIVGIGNHKELMENCDIYREIAQSQLKEANI
ncbi:MAG: ABC transporter ATP-binding protein [Firmicutes bacterium]|nr:ABC transporter ATP-binding protein [Bacillota bacterium]